jgi:transcriptional regulator with XRE-family HTH domain
MAESVGGESALNDDLVRLGARVREIRRRRAWTQQQVADAVSLTRVTINRLEAGKADIGVSRLFAVARVLMVEPAELFDSSDVEA